MALKDVKKMCSKFCTGKMAAHIVKCKSPSTMTIMQIVSEFKMSIDYGSSDKPGGLSI